MRNKSKFGLGVQYLALFASLSVAPVFGEDAQPVSSPLTLAQAVETVLQHDFQLPRLAIEAKAFSAEGDAKNVMPDPVLFAAMQNIPTDTFDLDQEAMTQFRFGIKQMFPKGNSLKLSKAIAEHSSQEQHLVKQQQVLKLRQQTEMAWLEAWYWQKTGELIEQDRVFLTQMLDFMQSVYQLGGNNQSDLIGAELELIRLDEKVLEAARQYQTYCHDLNTLANTKFHQTALDSELVDLGYQSLPTETKLYARLSKHPAFLILDENVEQLGKKISLSEQDFEPQWGLELSYGYRQDMPNGSDRADLLSAGFSVQVPLFSRPQKSQAVRAVKYKQAAIENKRLELFQKVRFELENLAQQFQNTQAQRQLYETQILPTLGKQKDSAIQSYESDKGDFRVVTDLYLREQSTRIKLQRLRVTEQVLISKMNYWLKGLPKLPHVEQEADIAMQTKSLMNSTEQLEMQP